MKKEGDWTGKLLKFLAGKSKAYTIDVYGNVDDSSGTFGQAYTRFMSEIKNNAYKIQAAAKNEGQSLTFGDALPGKTLTKHLKPVLDGIEGSSVFVAPATANVCECESSLLDSSLSFFLFRDKSISSLVIDINEKNKLSQKNTSN